MNVHPIALLTGAGFTHNFGGFLADQMWEKILNQPETYNTQSLRETMLDEKWELNFEALYSYLRKRNESEYPYFLAALNKTFSELDEVVRKNAKNPLECNVNLDQLKVWFHQFTPTERGKKGFIFTLNQDLLFERLNHNTVPWVPGLPNALQCGEVDRGREIKKVRLPESINCEDLCNHLVSLNLIKIHGSCNWLSGKKDAGDAIAIGLDKEGAIQDEPLLNCYLEIFQKVVNTANTQLWVIGYGFGDKHINDILADSIVRSNLRLCVINPQLPKVFFNGLKKAHRYPEIRKGISAYLSNSLRGIFQVNKDKSQPLKSIEMLMRDHTR